jgi:isoleucyl-tRNA synthetase
VLSELGRTCDAVIQHMDTYDNFAACTVLSKFVDALSNWYVRRSRDRFWGQDKQAADKLDAYWTLYECLLTTSKLVAPFVPFMAESFWQNLAGVFGERAVESVHLCDYPTSDPERIDDALSERMGLVREISSLGRSARMDAKLKVRQPLAKVEVILADTTHLAWLASHDALIQDELNVEQVEFAQQADQYITYQVQPNFKRLGPRVGKLMPKVKEALLQADGSALLAQLESDGEIRLSLPEGAVELDEEDVQIRLQAKPGWAAAQGRGCVVVLSTELTDRLVRKGLGRDLVRLVQERRKELDCQYTDRIEVGVVTDSDDLKMAVRENADYIRNETLAVKLILEPLAHGDAVDVRVADIELKLSVRVVHRKP